MRTLMFSLMRQSGVSLVALLVLLAIVYVGGEYVLELENSRWVYGTMLGILVVWVMGFAYIQFQAVKGAKTLEQSIQTQGKQQASAARPDQRAKVEALQGELDEAMAQLRRSKLGRGALYAMPWYMVIGPPGSGKSTLLRESGLNFPYMTKGRAKIRGVGGTRNCDWWFADQGILLDTAGRYTTEFEDREEWMSFLGMVKKARKRQPINGVLVAISIGDIVNAGEAELEEHADAIRERIDELTRNLGISFPVYLVFTKCDLLGGFVGFFDQLNKKERKQVWGFTFPHDRPRDFNLENELDSEIDELYRSLASRRVLRFASEGAKRKREMAYTFPLQFAMAKQRICDFVGLLLADNPYQDASPLRGCYFTSGTQEGTIINQLTRELYDIADLQIDVPADERKCYFVDDLFGNIVFPDATLVQPTGATLKQRKLMRIGGYAAAAVLGIGLSIYAISSWSEATTAIEETTLVAEQLVEVEATEEPMALETLEPLTDALRLVNEPSGQLRSDEQALLQQTYHDVMRRSVVTMCANGLRTKLTTLWNGRPQFDAGASAPTRDEYEKQKADHEARAAEFAGVRACYAALTSPGNQARADFAHEQVLETYWRQCVGGTSRSIVDHLTYLKEHWVEHDDLIATELPAFADDYGAAVAAWDGDMLKTLDTGDASDYRSKKGNKTLLVESRRRLDDALEPSIPLADYIDRNLLGFGDRAQAGSLLLKNETVTDLFDFARTEIAGVASRFPGICNEQEQRDLWNQLQKDTRIKATEEWRQIVRAAAPEDLNSAASVVDWFDRARIAPDQRLVGLIENSLRYIDEQSLVPVEAVPATAEKGEEEVAEAAAPLPVPYSTPLARMKGLAEPLTQQGTTFDLIQGQVTAFYTGSDAVEADIKKKAGQRLREVLNTQDAVLVNELLDQLIAVHEAMETAIVMELRTRVENDWKRFPIDWDTQYKRNLPFAEGLGEGREHLSDGQLAKLWAEGGMLDRLSAYESLAATVEKASGSPGALALSADSTELLRRLIVVRDAFKKGTQESLVLQVRFYDRAQDFTVQAFGQEWNTADFLSGSDNDWNWPPDGPQQERMNITFLVAQLGQGGQGAVHETDLTKVTTALGGFDEPPDGRWAFIPFLRAATLLEGTALAEAVADPQTRRNLEGKGFLYFRWQFEDVGINPTADLVIRVRKQDGKFSELLRPEFFATFPMPQQALAPMAAK